MGAVSGSEGGMQGTRSISAFFATRGAADAARAALVEAGLSFEAVKITDGRGTITGRSAAAKPSASGLIDTVKNAFAQDEPDEATEAERPAHELTAHVPPELFERAKAIIAREGDIVEQA